jgi:hypothetical protein
MHKDAARGVGAGETPSAASVLDTGSVDRDGVVALVIVITRGTPSLPRARPALDSTSCSTPFPGRPSRDQQRERYQAVVKVCEGLPARSACPGSLFETTCGNEDPDCRVTAG